MRVNTRTATPRPAGQPPPMHQSRAQKKEWTLTDKKVIHRLCTEQKCQPQIVTRTKMSVDNRGKSGDNCRSGVDNPVDGGGWKLAWGLHV